MASHQATASVPPPIVGAASEILVLAERRLAELDRLRAIGMEQAERLSHFTRELGGSPDAAWRAMVGGKGTIQEFDRLNRAIRQIVVLEFEIRGLFKGPDREGIRKPKLGAFRLDDLDDLDDWLERERGDLRDINDLNDLRVRLDYRKDPIDRLIADIRATLNAIAPEDDPFAPDAERKARESALARQSPILERVAERLTGRAELLPRRASMQMRTPEMLAQPVAGAAAPVKPALRRNGFRVPPTSPHNPKTKRARKNRRNRGPPR